MKAAGPWWDRRSFFVACPARDLRVNQGGLSIEIRWPTGQTQFLQDVDANQILRIKEQ
jgi:hypothetical protein